MDGKETAVKEEDIPSSIVEIPQTMPTAISQGLSIVTSDQWLNQLLVVALRSQFTGYNYHLWTCHIQTVLRPRNLEDHLTSQAPPQIDPYYKRWIIEEEILYLDPRFNDH